MAAHPELDVRLYQLVGGSAVANPTVAPTDSGHYSGGSLSSGNYEFAYSWITPSGETLISPTTTATIQAGLNGIGSLHATSPALPAGVTGVKWYMSVTVGSTTLQYSQTTSNPTVIITTGGTGSAPPSSNTTGGSASWVRMTFPQEQIESCQWEALDRGGFGNGKLIAQQTWENYNLTGSERCDVWLAGSLLYRGYVQLPEADLDVPERKTLGLFGTMARAGAWRVWRRYAYSAYVDISQIATDLINDVLKITDAAGQRMPGLQTDLETTGVQLKVFDALGKTFVEAMNQLIDVDPTKAIWGFDVSLVSGVWQDRVYLRPRATTTKYKLPIGGNISHFPYPTDTTQICNRIHVTGGPVAQPNLIYNGGFERPAPGDVWHGNYLDDPGFEDSIEYTTTAWQFVGDASVKSNSDPGGGAPGANTGNNWASLDQAGEQVQQDKPIDYTKPLTGSIWVRRGNPTGGSVTMDWGVQGLDSTGAVVATLYGDQNYDPGSSQLYLYRTGTFDFSAHSNVMYARYFAVSHSGTNNNDGVFVDDCDLQPRDQVYQDGWGVWTSPSGTAAGFVPQVNWTQGLSTPGDSTSPFSGGYCCRVGLLSGTIPTNGYIELRQEEWVMASLSKFRTYAFMVAAKAPVGQSFNVSLGCYLFDSNKKEYVTAPQTFVGPTDGSWNLLIITLNTGSSELQAQPYIRINNSVTTYLDDAMLVEGNPPSEYTDTVNHTFWEKNNYERTIDVTSTLLTGLSAAAAASITNYGVREQWVSETDVIDQASCVAYATGYFNVNGVPRHRAQMTLQELTTGFDFSGMYQVTNIPNEPPALPASRIAYEVTKGVKIDLELDNERPTLTRLLLDVQNRIPTATSTAASNSGGAPGTPYNAGGGVGNGSPSDADLVHLDGQETITGQKTFKTAIIGAGGYEAADGTLGISASPVFYGASSSGGATNQEQQPVFKSGLLVGWTQSVAAVPAAPSAPTATAGNGQVGLSWTAVATATSYNVLRGTVSGGPYTQIATTTGLVYLDSAVTNGTTYYYVLQAVNASGSSANSSQTAATPASAAPPAPTGLVASPGNGTAALSWAAALGATSYNVLKATVSGGPYTSVATGVTAASYTVSGLTNGTTYYFVVQAVSGGGTSVNSGEASCIPNSSSPGTVSGLALKLEGDQVVNVVNGGAVATWPDASPNGYSPSQATGVDQPTLATNDINGLPAVVFSGSQWLAHATANPAPDSSTIFVVMKTTAPQYGMVLDLAGGTGGTHTRQNWQVGTGTQPLSLEIGAVNTSTGLTVPSGTYGIYTSEYNASSGVLQSWQGQSPGNGNIVASASSSANGFVIGSDLTNAFDVAAHVAAVIIYNRALTAAERATVWGYLSAKYNLPL